MLTECWLRECDFYLAPTKPDYISTHGLQFLRQFRQRDTDMAFAEPLGQTPDRVSGDCDIDRVVAALDIGILTVLNRTEFVDGTDDVLGEQEPGHELVVEALALQLDRPAAGLEAGEPGALGDPVRDAAHFCSYVVAGVGLERLPAAARRAMTREFTREYFSCVPSDWRRQFPLHLAGALVEVACGIFRHQRPWWRERAEAAILEARDVLADVLPEARRATAWTDLGAGAAVPASARDGQLDRARGAAPSGAARAWTAHGLTDLNSMSGAFMMVPPGDGTRPSGRAGLR